MENQSYENPLEELKGLLDGLFQISRHIEQINYEQVQEEYQKVKHILEKEFGDRAELMVMDKLLNDKFSVNDFIIIHELMHRIIDGHVNEDNIFEHPYNKIGKFMGMCCLLHAQKCTNEYGGR